MPKKKTSAEGRSPPQELEVGPRSGPYLLVHLKETNQLNYRLRFEEHTLQIQVKAPSSDHYRVIKVYTPKAAKNSLIEAEPLGDGYPIQPTEEDTKSNTHTRGYQTAR